MRGRWTVVRLVRGVAGGAIQLDDGCLADDGMHLDLLFDQAHPRLDTAVRTVAHTTGPPVVTETTQPYLYHLAGTDGPQRRVRVRSSCPTGTSRSAA